MANDEGPKEGLATAAGASSGAIGSPPAGGQLELIDRAADELALQGVSPLARPKRGRGRPPGSRNKRTEEWVEYLSARYPSPLIALAETYSRPVDELAAELNCTKLEAFKIQIIAAKELAPFWHQKQPIAVAVEGGLLNLFIEASPEIAGMINDPVDDGETYVIEGNLLAAAANKIKEENEQDQPLGDSAGQELDSPELDSAPAPRGDPDV